MPLEPKCIEKHRSKTHLECNACSDNQGYTLTNLRQIDDLSEKIVNAAIEFPEWKPYHAKLEYTITLTVHETCTNAIEHGILGLDKQRKKQLLAELEEKYVAYVEAEWKRKGIGIHISVCLNADRILIGVHDEGDGFDFSQEGFAAVKESDLLDFSGRGLAMMEGMGVKLQWNRRGNSVLCSFQRPDLTAKKKILNPASTQ